MSLISLKHILSSIYKTLYILFIITASKAIKDKWERQNLYKIVEATPQAPAPLKVRQQAQYKGNNQIDNQTTTLRMRLLRAYTTSTFLTTQQPPQPVTTQYTLPHSTPPSLSALHHIAHHDHC